VTSRRRWCPPITKKRAKFHPGPFLQGGDTKGFLITKTPMGGVTPKEKTVMEKTRTELRDKWKDYERGRKKYTRPASKAKEGEEKSSLIA